MIRRAAYVVGTLVLIVGGAVLSGVSAWVYHVSRLAELEEW